MHPALLLFEVLLEIFSHLYQLPGVSSGLPHSRWRPEALRVSRKSLAALARTCKTFHEPAMTLLWADLDGIIPLLGCVPRLYPFLGSKRWQDLPEGIEPLSEHEARQFMRHAARVRALHMTTSQHFFLLTVLDATETCLFPKLWSLSLSRMVPDARHVQFLLSPALRRLSVSTLSLDIKSIVARSAALEDLFINMSHRSTADELSLVSDIIRSCTERLVNLTCRAPLDWAAWKHLSNIPTLLTVVIEGWFLSPLNHRLKFAPFLKLTALSLALTATEIITVMRHSEFPSLQSFTMHVRSWTRAEAEQFFRALSQCKACPTLKHIKIDSNVESWPDEQLGMSLTIIRQFLCFTQLQTLRLHVHHAIYLDDDLFVEAMSSWPHIRSLILIGHPHLRQPTVTFRGLFAALHFCPHLRALQVMIDTSTSTDIGPAAEPFQHTSLQILRVGTSSVVEAEAEAVARMIFCMLPRVEQVADPKWAWHQVNRHLKIFRSSAALGHHVTG
ncbi:hypothetical protein EDB19DRAFT_239404 [Suillus lakei]|nr:hypothetical protein EDB19DRAFT_239404 [Suillus lakei]